MARSSCSSRPLIGAETINEGQVSQAVDIIRQRIDANGVSEAEITTQGGQNIVVSIPGRPDGRAARRAAEAVPAALPGRLRPGARPERRAGEPERHAQRHADPVGHRDDAATGTPRRPRAPHASTSRDRPERRRARRAAAAATGTATPSAPAAGRRRRPHAARPRRPHRPPPRPRPPSRRRRARASSASAGTRPRPTQPPRRSPRQYVALDCSTPGAVDKIVDDPALPIATCGDDRVTKYVLGPSEIDGSEIADASSGYQPGPNGQPSSIVEVALSFKDAGKAKFAAVTKRLFGLQSQPPLDQFAVVLDKSVITAPQARAVINDGRASITGSFTIDSAKQLAEQLKFGALPISFALQTQDNITPQLGEEQLRIGLLAGFIGLLLVVVYSLFQYRALGLVTVASLLVASILTYLAVTVLGTTHGFRLTMAGSPASSSRSVSRPTASSSTSSASATRCVTGVRSSRPSRRAGNGPGARSSRPTASTSSLRASSTSSRRATCAASRSRSA